MVGLVIVSHSHALAVALQDLVRTVTNHANIPLAIAAGVGPDRSEFGTDALDIMEAIQSVYSPEGVVVLMDLGSAVLSAQMALDLLPPEVAAGVSLCGAAAIEGSISAAVQISLGSSAQAVCQEAMLALGPKAEQLGPPVEREPKPEPTAAPAAAGANSLQIVLTLKNEHGLHARPAARFVQTTASFDADIRVRNERTGKGPVQAKSLNSLATLGAVGGDQITILASGSQAQQALDALASLVESSFGEPTGTPETPVRSTQPQAQGGSAPAGEFLQAVPVSEGIAVGPLARMRSAHPMVPTGPVDDAQAAWGRLTQAIQKVQQAVGEQRRLVAGSLGETNAAIFDAHLLILQDPELVEPARRMIFEQNQNEAAAWDASIAAMIQTYQSLDDPYLRQRALDISGLGDQVLNALSGKPAVEAVMLTTPSILFATELTPTQTAALDMSKILGLITTAGGPTSHSAILARAMGIPAVSGAGPRLEALPADNLIGLDGFNGRIWPSPGAEQLAWLQTERAAWLERTQAFKKSSQGHAVTRDGHRVEVVANVGSLKDAQASLSNGAEGIGLLRTEFLFLTRDTPPDEGEQVQALTAIAQCMKQLPVIVRTLDAGGDKELPYLKMPAEANPFLGVRAIRLCFQQPELFRTQLKAILRAGAEGNFRIMFPMVANLAEVNQARQFVDEVHRELSEQGIAHQWPIQTGIMVEIPSAAIMSESLAEAVDFFSIGTNDLTQYTLAAERGNPALAHLNDALHPAVLTLIQKVAAAAHAHGKWVGVCGELAGDPLATAVLVGLGVDELSLNSAGIPRIKAILRELEFSQAQAFAQKVLAARSAGEVRELVKTEYPEL